MKLKRYNGNFAQCLAQIAKAGQKVATAKKGMQDRIKQGVNSDPCNKGAWFPENFNYVKGKVLVALADYNPQIPYAEQAVESNKKSGYFQLTQDIKLQGKSASQLLLEIAEEDAAKPIYNRRVLDSKRKETFSIPANRLGEEEISIFLARSEKIAKDYGILVHDALTNPNNKNPEITFYLASKQKQDFSAGFWLCRLDDIGRSGFDGYRSLDGGSGSLFGVVKSAKGTAKISQPNLKEII